MTETPDHPGSPDPSETQTVDQILEDLTMMAHDLTTEVRQEWRRVRRDQSMPSELQTKLKKELLSLLNTSKDAEGKLDEHRTKRAGRAGEFALDLGAARLEVGRRLDSIRAARGSGGVS